MQLFQGYVDENVSWRHTPDAASFRAPLKRERRGGARYQGLIGGVASATQPAPEQAVVDHRRVLTAPAAAQDREVEEMMDGPGKRMQRALDEMIQYCDTVFPSLMARRKRILDVFIPAFDAWRAETLGALARCTK